MKRSLAVVFVAIALALVAPTALWAISGCQFFCSSNRVSATLDGFQTNQQVTSGGSAPAMADSRGSRPSKRDSPNPYGPILEYDYRSTCDVPGGDGGCGGETIECAAAGAESVFVAQRQVAPTVGGWSLQPGSVCLTPQQQIPWSPAQLQAFVDDYFQRLPLPLPALDLQPGDKAVVNLPLIAASDPPGQTTFTVEQAPFPTITITATVSWRWSWGDGQSTTTTWPGRAYDGTDPRSSPAHYVSHSYAAPSAGTSIGVTTVWSGTYSIAGGGQQPIAGTVERTTTRTLPVTEYGATITGG